MGNQQAQPVSHPNHESITSQLHVSDKNKVDNKPKKATKVLAKLPHNYNAIINDSDLPIDQSSTRKICEQLCDGVYLNGRKMKYWVKQKEWVEKKVMLSYMKEKKREINCFMVFAQGLSITWGNNDFYWYFREMETREHGNLTVAQLRNVSRLEVHGRFHTENLTRGITYQVTYLMLLVNHAFGWEVPVNLRLTLPNGKKQEHKENLGEKPRNEWIRVRVGEFKASSENNGEIEFSMYEFGGNMKTGLVIGGALIEPKT